MALKRYNSGTADWELVSAKGQEITVSPTAPSSPDVGDIWIDSDEVQTLPSSNSFVSNEVPTGAVNGSNTTYVTSDNYIPGSLEVFVNGLKQASAHVTETTPASGTFDLDVAPATGDVIDCTYQVAADPYSGNADTLDGYHAADVHQAFTQGVLGDTEYFTSSGTWTKPANLKFIIVEVQGAGGGGSGAATSAAGQSAAGGGGAAGAYARKKILAGSLASTETVTIGAAGAGGATGDNTGGTGGTSSFGTHVSCTGGSGGFGGGASATVAMSSGNSGTGGVATGGDINIDGQDGGNKWRVSATVALSGAGANSRFGFGGTNQEGRNFSNAGRPGIGYGSGGSAGVTSVSSAVAGGAGAPGIVIVYEYF